MKSALQIATIGVGISTVAICVLTYRYIRRRKITREPKDAWQHIGSLKEIALYPIKSSSDVEVEEAECDGFGLNQFGFRDRRLLLIHEADEKIVSVGKYPLMLSIKIKIISAGCLQLTAPNMEPLTVNLNEFSAEARPSFVKQLKGYSLQLIECLPAQHIWFSRVVLGKESGLRLYLTTNVILETSWWRTIENELMPVMAVHEKSVEYLNSKLAPKNHVNHKQFRGNLLIESAENVAPCDEDNWLWLKIGDNEQKSTILRFNSPCVRCIIPNIDIFSCKRNEDFEPLKTLRKFRLRNHPTDPEMGVYFDVYKTGIVKCGDPVYVQYK